LCLADGNPPGVHTPPRAPTANAIAERPVRTIRTECLNHLIAIDERHLRAVLAEFVAYYNRDRPHCSLGPQSPLPSSVRAHGRVMSRPVLGGLHHGYARAALKRMEFATLQGLRSEGQGVTCPSLH
jgi:hypothetical protein